jgi:hypothetical protein
MLVDANSEERFGGDIGNLNFKEINLRYLQNIAPGLVLKLSILVLK